MNRYKAFGWHLLVSVGLALLSAALVFLLWYPGSIASATGITDIFLMVLMVDVVLGPLITLIVYNTKKKELKRDLAVVALVQVFALLYGLHIAFIARPVYIVYNVGRFDLVYANDLTHEKLLHVRPEYQSLPLLGPQVIAAVMPADVDARNAILFSAISGGDDLPQLPQYYEPYATQKTAALSRVKSLNELIELNKDNVPGIDALEKKYANVSGGIGYFPLKAKTADLAVIVQKNTGNFLEVASFHPW